MAMSAALTNVQAEFICPVCKDYFKDPVTIDCGHNFCDSCIQMAWNTGQYEFPCPACLYPHEERQVIANHQLGRLVDLGRSMHSSRSSEMQQEEESMCWEHNQALSLFCEDERELLCPLCMQPPAHEGHDVRPVVEAAIRHRQRLSSYRDPLKKLLAQAQKLAFTQERKFQELRVYTKEQRDHVISEFEQLTRMVGNEQEATLNRLQEDERDLHQKVSANINALSRHVSALKRLFVEVADSTVMPKGSFLREVKSIQAKWENIKCPSMWTVQVRTVAYSLPPLCSELEKVIQTFAEEVTLDPRMAHPCLHLSEDRKSVVYMEKESNEDEEAQQYLEDVVVLGSEGYSSGRHYWEVQVGHKPEWAVGVCSHIPANEAQSVWTGPKRCWTVQLQDGDYLDGVSGAVLALKDKPTGIGIFLDYELGRISFYDARDRSHIHSFMATFSDVLRPYFCVGPDPTPLTVSAVRDSTDEVYF